MTPFLNSAATSEFDSETSGKKYLFFCIQKHFTHVRQGWYEIPQRTWSHTT